MPWNAVWDRLETAFESGSGQMDPSQPILHLAVRVSIQVPGVSPVQTLTLPIAVTATLANTRLPLTLPCAVTGQRIHTPSLDAVLNTLLAPSKSATTAAHLTSLTGRSTTYESLPVAVGQTMPPIHPTPLPPARQLASMPLRASWRVLFSSLLCTLFLCEHVFVFNPSLCHYIPLLSPPQYRWMELINSGACIQPSSLTQRRGQGQSQSQGQANPAQASPALRDAKKRAAWLASRKRLTLKAKCSFAGAITDLCPSHSIPLACRIQRQREQW